jgi:hypothetical protein
LREEDADEEDRLLGNPVSPATGVQGLLGKKGSLTGRMR